MLVTRLDRNSLRNLKAWLWDNYVQQCGKWIRSTVVVSCVGIKCKCLIWFIYSKWQEGGFFDCSSLDSLLYGWTDLLWKQVNVFYLPVICKLIKHRFLYVLFSFLFRLDGKYGKNIDAPLYGDRLGCLGGCWQKDWFYCTWCKKYKLGALLTCLWITNV